MKSSSLVIWAACLGYSMVILDTTVLNVALPSIASQTGANGSQQQWIVDSYVLVMTALLLVGGGLIDRFGATRIFRIGIVVFMSASLACAMSTTADLLLAARAVQGVGGALLIPATLAIVAQEFSEPAKRARAIAIIATVTASPQAFGPSLGGILVDTLGWRSIFLLNVPIGIIALLCGRKIAAVDSHPRRLDIAGVLLFALALGSLTFGLVRFEGGYGSPVALLLAIVVAIAAAAAFVAVERRSARPLLPDEVRRSIPVNLYVLTGLFVFITFYGSLFAANLYLQQVLGFSAVAAGVTLVAGGFPVFALPVIVSWVASDRSPWLLTFIGSAVATCGALIGLLVGRTPDRATIVVCLLVVGVGFGILTSPHLALAMSVSPINATGVVSALANAGRQAGYLIGVALVGMAGIDVAGYRDSMLIAAISGVMALATLLLARKVGRKANREETDALAEPVEVSAGSSR